MKPSHSPSLEVFREKAAACNIVPVFRDILADTDTPVSAFMKINDKADAFLLESVEGGEKWGRYSFLGASAKKVIRSKGRTIEVVEDGSVTVTEGDPIEAVRTLMGGFRPAALEGAPRFFGGAIGYMGYDIVRHVEKLPDSSPKLLGLHDIYLMFTDTFLVFDNVEHRIKVVSNAYIDGTTDLDAAYADAVRKIDALVDRLRGGLPAKKQARPEAAPIKITSNFKKEDFLKAVERVKEYIVDGDIFQCVLSQRFSTPVTADPFDIYRALRVINPSPYMFYLKLGEATLVGSSPEILVRVEGENVNVKPIAGTRKRGHNEDEDLSLEKDLLADPKELSEHIMLVDLGRNDVGRVSRIGSVKVTDFITAERYSHVMHLVSHVEGTLSPGLDCFDVLKACFPAGTVSGAPKIRAMEIIEELEPHRRGPYAGAVGYFGFTGNMDTCITIRTIIIKDGVVHVQAGAGLVADSVPEKEYQETVNKAMGMMRALEAAERGLL